MTPHRAPLTREAVLDEALRLIDDEGLDALTMRRLGQRLDRDPMAIYRHAESRAALLDGVVGRMLEGLGEEVAGDDWQQRLRTLAHRFRAAALQHPHAVPLLATLPLATPLGLRAIGSLRPVERILSDLDDAGFAPHDALHIYRAFYGLLLGHILTELQEVVADPDETEALLRLGLHRLPASEFPRLRALAGELVDYDGGRELDQSVSTLLAGLAAQLSGR